jgi:hypothetical protein
MRILPFAVMIVVAGAMLDIAPVATHAASAYSSCSNASGHGKKCKVDNLGQCQQSTAGAGGPCGFNDSAQGRSDLYNSYGRGQPPLRSEPDGW